MGAGFTDSHVPEYISDALLATANSSNCMLQQYTRGFVSIFIRTKIGVDCLAFTEDSLENKNEQNKSFFEKLTNCIFLKQLIVVIKYHFQGHPRLVHALSALYSKLVDRKIDAFNEVLVTCGAYEALYVAIQGYVMQKTFFFDRKLLKTVIFNEFH